MADFLTAYSLTARSEGGYQSNPADNGNYNSAGQLVGTKYGISAPVYEDWIGRLPNVADMTSITPYTARQIFKSWYWDRYNLSALSDQHTANHIFDIIVNHGPYTGTKIIQRALQDVGQNVYYDGLYGGQVQSAILDTINQGKQPVFNNRMVHNRLQTYNDIIAGNPSQIAFKNGWIRRAKEYLYDRRQQLLILYLVLATVGLVADNV